ncbi:MAG: ABC transporter substrate-binding protein [Deltaproteobacteria bacterium]|nr:ABC transporter substrate-binding protein [Deltaproteobacteria bacterium]
MFGLKSTFVRWGILGLALIFITGIFFYSPAAGKETESAPGWTFTEKFPKPPWWTWGKDYEPSKPKRGGYYRGAAVRYIGLMNPNHWPVNDWVTMTYIYEIVIYSDGNYMPSIPWLVVDWEFLDPLTAVVKLRKGVKFHDGSDFNAESFKYQLEWIKDKKNGCWDRALLNQLKSTELIDAYTLKFHFKKPWAGFWGILANVPGYPISAKALKGDSALNALKSLEKKAAKARKKADALKKKAKAGTEKNKKAAARAEKKAAGLEAKARAAAKAAEGAKSLDVFPIGSGMFMFEEASPGNYVKLKRNPNWWFGPSIGRPEMPYFDGLITTVIPDPSVRLANLRAGKIDGMGLDRSQFNLVKDESNLKVYVYPQNHVAAMRFNLVKGPCKDIRVRKAISHALDRKALIEGTQFGLGRIASCMYPGDHWTHNPELKPVKYDPELSRKLLAEAGYPDGLTVKGYMGNDTNSMNVAEAIKNMLAQVGVKWKVDLLEPAAISDRMKNLEYDFAAGGWGWIFDPDHMPTGLYMPEGGFNYGRSSNEKAMALIEAGRQEIDLQKRQKIYFELEKVLYENYEDAWLWWNLTATAYRKNVMGWNTELYLKGRQGFWYSHPMWFKDGRP